jgi:hypothetical protein
MSKPLFRFTVGSCLQQGLDILAESINRTTNALGIDNWDWVVCYNGLTAKNLEFLQSSVGQKPIQFIGQNWATCPVPDNCQTPRRRDGSFEWNGTRCGGTMWKVCPPRMRINTHEIIMDNDVVLFNKFPQIDEFLYSDKVLLLEEPIRFYGRYDCLFPSDPPFLNSGFMGFPPRFDFGTLIYKAWQDHGSYENLSQADEQGLLTYVLSQHPNIRISPDQMIEILHRNYAVKVTGKEQGVHFTQANRIDNHYAWREYKKMMKI